MKSLIASCLYGAGWGALSGRLGITATEPTFWAVSIIGVLILTIAIKD